MSSRRRTRRRRRKRGAVRTKHNTPKAFDLKTMKVIPNPHYKKPKKPSPITLNVQGQQVTFQPREVDQQRKMLTQLKKLSPASSSKSFQLGSFNPQTNKGGRRKKSTRKRRKMRGGEEYTLDTLYDFLSENSEETQDALSIDVGPILAILKDFKEESGTDGSYYIMNIERNRADVINAGVVTEALKKGFNGSALNSYEYMSMEKTRNETTLLETFFTKHLPIIKAHYEFKPGAPGAAAAKVSFNAAKGQQSGGRKKRTRKRRKKRRKSRRKRKR